MFLVELDGLNTFIDNDQNKKHIGDKRLNVPSKKMRNIYLLLTIGVLVGSTLTYGKNIKQGLERYHLTRKQVLQKLKKMVAEKEVRSKGRKLMADAYCERKLIKTNDHCAVIAYHGRRKRFCLTDTETLCTVLN